MMPPLTDSFTIFNSYQTIPTLVVFIQFWHNLFHFSITYLSDLPTSTTPTTPIRLWTGQFRNTYDVFNIVQKLLMGANKAQIGEKSVKFTLKLRQFYPKYEIFLPLTSL